MASLHGGEQVWRSRVPSKARPLPLSFHHCSRDCQGESRECTSKWAVATPWSLPHLHPVSIPGVNTHVLACSLVCWHHDSGTQHLGTDFCAVSSASPQAFLVWKTLAPFLGGYRISDRKELWK